MPKDFETTDLYLAAAITLFSDLPIQYRIINKKVLFVFPSCPELYRAIDKYNHGESINVMDYAQRLRRLRAEMLMKKNNEKHEEAIKGILNDKKKERAELAR